MVYMQSSSYLLLDKAGMFLIHPLHSATLWSQVFNCHYFKVITLPFAKLCRPLGSNWEFRCKNENFIVYCI